MKDKNIFWAIVTERGDVVPITIDRTRKEAIGNLDCIPTLYESWLQLRRRGYQCVRVQITEIKKKGK